MLILLILFISFPIFADTNIISTNQTNKTNQIKKIEKSVRDKIKESIAKTTFTAKGSKIVTIENNRFSGDEKYRPPSAYTPYRRVETARFYGKGSLFGIIEAEAELVSSSEGDEWGFNKEIFKPHILLRTPHFELEFGDITVSYPYSEFVLNNKSISGIKARLFFERFEYLGVYSIPKGKSKQTEFYGDGTQGPYLLNTGGYIILENTEKVLVDGVLQKRGIDYLIDIYNGEIIFLKKGITTSQKITVIYEYRENIFNRKLVGSSFSIKPFDFLRIGLDFAYEYDNEEIYKRAIESGVTLEEKPIKHIITGINSDLILNPGEKFFEFFQINQEWAYNYKNNDITTEENELFVQAYRNKTRLKGFFYDLGLGGKIIGKDYQQIGNVQLKEDSYDYGANLELRPTKFLFYNTDYYKLKDKDVNIINQQEDYKNKITVIPTKYNKIILSRRDYKDINSVDRKENYNQAEVLTSFSNFEITIGSIYNEFKQNRPENLKDERYERGGLIQIATKNINWLKVSTSVEATENESSINGIYKKLKINSSLQLSHKEKYQLMFDGSYTKGEIHTVQSATNLPLTNKPSDETWILDLKSIIRPHPFFENDTSWKINNYKEIYNDIYQEIIQHTGSTKITSKPAKYIQMDYQFSPIFHIKKGTREKTQWSYEHLAKLKLSPLKEMANQAQYQQKIRNIRPKLEPDKIQKEDTKEFKNSLKVIPIINLSLDFNIYYRQYKKEGYYDIGLDDLLGDHSLKLAFLEELTKHFDTEIKKRLKENWIIGSSFGITRYQLKDDYKIGYGRYYLPGDSITAAKLSDLNYQEIISGVSLGWTPNRWISFLFNYNRSYLIDKTGFYSPKITNILKQGISFNFINFAMNFNTQYDSSYYIEERIKPKRIIYRGDINYHYKNNVSFNGIVMHESSKIPDYNYTTSRINLEISF